MRVPSRTSERRLSAELSHGAATDAASSGEIAGTLDLFGLFSWNSNQVGPADAVVESSGCSSAVRPWRIEVGRSDL